MTTRDPAPRQDEEVCVTASAYRDAVDRWYRAEIRLGDLRRDVTLWLPIVALLGVAVGWGISLVLR